MVQARRIQRQAQESAAGNAAADAAVHLERRTLGTLAARRAGRGTRSGPAPSTGLGGKRKAGERWGRRGHHFWEDMR